MATKPDYIAYQVQPTGKKNEQGKKVGRWYRIGAAWRNKDDSISAQTLHGRIVLRPPQSAEEAKEPEESTTDFDDG